MVRNQNKVGRNDLCPCGNGRKYKHCCEGTLDWNKVFRSDADWRRHLSIRGRNLYFANRISEVLQLDDIGDKRSLKDYKAAFTAKVVREIHEILLEVWPPDLDIVSSLRKVEGDVSGLYIGDYGVDYISQGIVRHSMYANKILIVDPFTYPGSVRDEYNPILNPDQYRTQTLKNVNFWFALMPWINAGIVEVIRTPNDFDRKLNWESIKRQRKKFEENKELKAALEVTSRELKSRHFDGQAEKLLLLANPDSNIRKIFMEQDLGKDGLTADQFIKHVQELRDTDPNFLGPLGSNGLSDQIYGMSSGASYEIAQLTASITGSYLVTDLSSKWREIELDRECLSLENQVWAPLAKAIQNSNLKYLNAIRLDHALTLRKEGRLETLRSFLRKVWKNACKEDGFADINCQLLGEELEECVQEAEEEWKQIDRDLLKLVGAQAVTGFLAAGPLIAAGHGAFLAAAALIGAGATGVTISERHKGFPEKFPAAFFMNLKSGE